MNSIPILSIVTFLPVMVGIALLFLKRTHFARNIALGTTLLNLFISVGLWVALPKDGALHFVERWSWIPSLNVDYLLGLDGISLLFFVLTTVVLPMAILTSWGTSHEKPAYYGLLLLLQGGLLGVFTANNFIHWFFFWELSLIPAYFLVKGAGGLEQESAANQFFIYTMVGSIAMLVGFLGLYLVAGTFDFQALSDLRARGELDFGKLGAGVAHSDTVGLILFLLVFLGFAVKVPLFPFHSWLPVTYTQAASPVTMVLTGAMSKMGVYGLIRVLLPIFPEQIATLHQPLLILAVVTIVYSAFAAMGQAGLKSLLAYSSMSHLGYCFLGIFASAKAGTPDLFNPSAALNGVLFQVFSHGIIAAGLFAFVAFLERRHGTYMVLDQFGGLRKVVPVTAGLMGILIFASLGLPGLSGFVGEFLIFKGTFAMSPIATSISVLGLLITAIFLLRMLGQIFNGPLPGSLVSTQDLTARELLAITPAIALTFTIGIFPAIAGVLINPAVQRLVQQLHS